MANSALDGQVLKPSGIEHNPGGVNLDSEEVPKTRSCSVSFRQLTG
jgi:hypothetical protein